MSNLSIHIELDNAAFKGENCGPEVASILETLAKQIRSTSRSDLEGHSYTPRDANGNCVGTCDFEIDDEEEDDDRPQRFNSATVFLTQFSLDRLVTIAEALGLMAFPKEERRALIQEIASWMVDEDIDREDILAIVHGE